MLGLNLVPLFDSLIPSSKPWLLNFWSLSPSSESSRLFRVPCISLTPLVPDFCWDVARSPSLTFIDSCLFAILLFLARFTAVCGRNSFPWGASPSFDLVESFRSRMITEPLACFRYFEVDHMMSRGRGFFLRVTAFGLFLYIPSRNSSSSIDVVKESIPWKPSSSAFLSTCLSLWLM